MAAIKESGVWLLSAALQEHQREKIAYRGLQSNVAPTMGKIRKCINESNVIACVVALPGSFFVQCRVPGPFIAP